MIQSPNHYRANAPAGINSEVVEKVIRLEQARAHLSSSSIYTLGHLAHLSETSLEFLDHVVRRVVDPYNVFTIKKRNGSNRSIAAPLDQLKVVQRWLASNVFSHMEVSNAAYAYRSGIGVASCTQVHVGSRWMLKLDLKDFFHQFSERDVYFLMRDNLYSKLVALEVARITTRSPKTPQDWLPAKYTAVQNRRITDGLPYRAQMIGYLAQGAPSSGAISNALSLAFDKKVLEFCGNERLNYSRYADDLFLSSPSVFSRARVASIYKHIAEVVAQSGHILNSSKTRVLAPGVPLRMLGVVAAADRVRLSQRFQKRVDRHLYGASKFGVVQHATYAGFDDAIGFLHHLKGLIDYANDIDPELARGFYEKYFELSPAPNGF